MNHLLSSAPAARVRRLIALAASSFYAALLAAGALARVLGAGRNPRKLRSPELSGIAPRVSGSRRVARASSCRLEPGTAAAGRARRRIGGQPARSHRRLRPEVPDSTRSDQVVAPRPRRGARTSTAPIWAADYLSTQATGADVVQAVVRATRARASAWRCIDSGITDWHDDLTQKTAANSRSVRQSARQRSSSTSSTAQTQPYDDHGHGSHVAGIILGNGYDSDGKQAGMAPDAALVALKVLDKDGKGTISNIIAALDWVGREREDVQHPRRQRVGRRRRHRIRTGPIRSRSPPSASSTRASSSSRRRATSGKNAKGEKQYGGILSPGQRALGADGWRVEHARARSTRATTTCASFSSLGPTRGDYLAKPDLVAPGFGILSLAVPGSTLYVANPRLPRRGHRQDRLSAVPEPQRHQHGGAAGGGRGGADAPGEPEAHAEPGQGDSSVHRAESSPATTRSSRAPASWMC